jgi:NAD-dependent deacetylase
MDPVTSPLRGPGGRLEQARALLREAPSVLVLSGAGVSAESGVPTFRGSGGLWRNYRPEELATPEAFARDPRLVWEWYGWRRELIGDCRPNAAHRALAQWLLEDPEMRVLFTQNVDGLHELAMAEACGVAVEDLPPALRPRTLHGQIFRVRCTACGLRSLHRGPIDSSRVDTLPHCTQCEALLRPDVVWFGEALDEPLFDDATRKAQHATLSLVIGTSGLVQPAASLPHMTLAGGGVVIEVNPDPTPISQHAHVWLAGAAAVMLPELLRHPA